MIAKLVTILFEVYLIYIEYWFISHNLCETFYPIAHYQNYAHNRWNKKKHSFFIVFKWNTSVT